MSPRQCTLLGCLAIALWSAVVALLRQSAEHFGPIAGAALVYSLASVMLLKFVGIPNLKRVSSGYLLWGTLLFVCYEICLSLSLGFALSREQAIEMGVINYLWPCFTVLMGVIATRQHVKWYLLPGLAFSLLGTVWAVTNGAFSISNLFDNISTNPLSYGLAFSGAIIWAIYCNVTRIHANRSNLITLFFIATALSLWAKYLLFTEQQTLNTVTLSLETIGVLVAAAGIMAGGYALWNIAIIGGNMMLLATLSYFIPIFSTLLSALLLSTSLSTPFWQGVTMVTAGSLLCWRATETKKPA